MFIDIDNVSKTFLHNKTPILALKEIDLTIEKGEFVCFLGPSGCGKTTLLNMLAGYDTPSEGEIKIDGEIVTKPSIKRVTVFQGYGLLPWRTARKNIELGLESKKINKHERKKIVDEYIDMVGLTDFADHFPYEMSGGMRQKVAIARALAVDPEIIFMDEPFNALDLISRSSIQNSVVDFWEKKKKTIIFVTHFINEAIKLANRIVIFSPYPGIVVRILKVPPGAKIDDSPEYNAIRNEIIDVCEVLA
ncbi:MAG: ABC transporter ATP-binding protein [Defluviitaleaceae bacterium]|nr:ABC transporter ATP-binding protein [Defluviitaleaceae bacterium]